MKLIKFLCFSCAVGLSTALFGAEWTYDNSTKRMTTADGWSIKISSVSADNVLTTPNNGGFIEAAPATGDREDGTYTLDLTGTITDSTDPSKTYTLGNIGYYAFNGFKVAVSKLIVPDTIVTWAAGGSLGVFGNCRSSSMEVVPRNFLSGVQWNASSFAFGVDYFYGEVHLKGIVESGNCGFALKGDAITKIFLYPSFVSFSSTTFANRGSNSRYDLYFMQGTAVPSGIDNTSYGTGNYAYLNIPSGETSWETWLESNAREFTDSDLETFQTRFPDKATPQYVITAGKFNNAYAAFWNGAPGVSVVSMGGVAADEIVPAQGTFEKPRTDDPIQFSAPAECDGYTCAGYTLEVTSTDWDAAVKTTVEDVTSFELDIDTGKKYRVTWLWASDAANSVTVSSNMGAEFGSCSPAYGIYTDFPDGAMTFTAPNPAYDESIGYRYNVQGYKLTDADGNETTGTGTEFVYNTEMGVVTLEWQWVLDGYKLACDVDGYLELDSSIEMDDNFYLPINSIVTLTALDGENGEFYHWAGETAAIDSYSRSITIEMTKPKTLAATPKCKWYFNGSYLTNAIGWKIGVGKISGSSNLYLGGDCVKTTATVPWSNDRYLGKEVHLLDLSLPIVSDTTGEPFYITKINSYCFRRQTAGYLAKLIMPETWNEIGDMGFGTAIFTSQDYLEEITPVFFPKDIVGPNQYPSFGGIKYSGDICLEAGCFLGIGGNCSITFRHGKTQNIYFGTNFVTLGTSETIFSWSQANYVLWFKNCPAAFPSSRNKSGDYSFYVRYPSGNSEWSEYLSLNARKFEESDESNFAARFPEAAAAGLWPKMTFTNGFFNGTWARVNGNAGSVIFVK